MNKKRKWFVDGCAGFMGSNFVRHLLEYVDTDVVIGYDKLMYAGSFINVNTIDDKRLHFVHGDICNLAQVEKVLERYGIDTIIHFAAESHNDRSILHPDSFVQNNIVGTQRMLEASKNVWLKNKVNNPKFIHFSTDEVFGDLGIDEPAWTEESCHWPNTPYSATKSGSDAIVKAYHGTYNFPAIIINCTNNYGPRQFPEKFIPKMICNAMSGAPLTLHGDGSHVRDWIYVDDMCDAVLALVNNGVLGEAYNVGGRCEVDNSYLLNVLCSILDEKLPKSDHKYDELITYIPDRPNNDHRYALNTMKIANHTGWVPKMGLEMGLAWTIDWYVHNQDWVNQIQELMNTRNWLSWEDFEVFE